MQLRFFFLLKPATGSFNRGQIARKTEQKENNGKLKRESEKERELKRKIETNRKR